MSWKTKVGGGSLAVFGYMLSPLSWWNDAFVNLPLAYVFAWGISRFHKPAFSIAFVVGYWLTNVAGLLLLHVGGRQLLSRKTGPYNRRDLVKDLLVSLVYTALIVSLIGIHVLKPPEDYIASQPEAAR
jgi:hypothetical protein